MLIFETQIIVAEVSHLVVYCYPLCNLCATFSFGENLFLSAGALSWEGHLGLSRHSQPKTRITCGIGLWLIPKGLLRYVLVM